MALIQQISKSVFALYNGPHNLHKGRGGDKIYYSMMSKHYTAAFKAKVVQELLKEEKTLVQIASEYEVHPTQHKNWRAIALEGLPGLFEKQESTAELQAAYEQQQTELYAEIGKLTTQVTWLKKKFQL